MGWKYTSCQFYWDAYSTYITGSMEQRWLQIFSIFLGRTTKYNPNSTVGTGPCAKWFKGEECPFYPKFAIKEIFKVGCADAEGSYCDCIYFCWNNEDVTKFFAMGLKSEEYDDCTTRLNFSLILAGSVGSVCKLWEKLKTIITIFYF